MGVWIYKLTEHVHKVVIYLSKECHVSFEQFGYTTLREHVMPQFGN